MNDLAQMFERQAAWQRSRSSLPWAEKLRLSAVMRESLTAFRWSHNNGSKNSDGTTVRKRKERDFTQHFRTAFGNCVENGGYGS